ncbi:Sporulation protein YlmC, PRC-barrel domain family [Variovorax sp. OK605]|jgi:sporulation protein YlmC with PRC-barrel domain|uniref:PRC-barrel domain-containing protein n=1 Tax=Variovorax sp. OK605 TaxID=1855317 RepID=UPI0008E9CD00|nr:PRC-barrel domain-containing protein [Variovorax sp. OK605]SFQ60578.1 Sporulation protein YlmC, PRC-barrel domain family [Variovorax sp. OK605]
MHRFTLFSQCTAVFAVAMVFAVIDGAHAQVAGSIPTAAERTEPNQVVTGWSARQSLLGREVYNAEGERLGKALDLIVGTDMRVSFVVIALGLRLGTAQDTVAVPAGQLRVQGSRLVLADSTRRSLAAQPVFLYAPITRTQSLVVERAQREVDRSRLALATLERQAEQASGEDKVRAEQRIAQLRSSQRAVQDRVAELDAAGAAQWQAVEAQVGQASARLREAMRNSAL